MHSPKLCGTKDDKVFSVPPQEIRLQDGAVLDEKPQQVLQEVVGG